MVNLNRIRITWSGFPGSPGVSTFYSVNVSKSMGALKTLYDDFAGSMPSDVVITYPTAGDVIDPVTGDLVSAWGLASTADTTGANTGGYAAPVGVLIRWETGTILDGHRLRGRTYMVPMASGCFGSDGTIDTALLADFRTAVDACTSTMDGSNVVWHRPAGARVGGFSAVTSGTVPDEAVVLRSRRD